MLWNWSKIPIITTKTAPTLTGHCTSSEPSSAQVSDHVEAASWTGVDTQWGPLQPIAAQQTSTDIQTWSLVQKPTANKWTYKVVLYKTSTVYFEKRQFQLLFCNTVCGTRGKRFCDCWNELCYKSKDNRASLSPKPEIGALSILGDRWCLPSTPDTLTAHCTPASLCHLKAVHEPFLPPSLSSDSIPVQLSLQ